MYSKELLDTLKSILSDRKICASTFRLPETCFTVHNTVLGNLLNDKDAYRDASGEYRFSLLVALLKLNSLFEDRMCGNNLQYDADTKTISLKDDIYSLKLGTPEGDAWWDSICYMYGLYRYDMFRTPDTVEEGLGIVYMEASRLRFVCKEGSFEVKGRKIVCSLSDKEADALSVFSRYSWHISFILKTAIDCVANLIGELDGKTHT